MRIPENDGMIVNGRETEQRGCWYKPIRCSICTTFIWFYPIALNEPVEAPEPRREWVLCKPCHKALLVEMARSPMRSPMRLRIAMGLVAAERSPKAYISSNVREYQAFQREFAWFTWALILFTLFHVVIFAILWSVPR
ncbi:MAG TPA: hypothetical protein VF043_37035 [Ktedonobacteraceae bacterium]